MSAATYGRSRQFSGVPLPPSDWTGWSLPANQPVPISKTWGEYITLKREVFLDYLASWFGKLGDVIEEYPMFIILLFLSLSAAAIPGIFFLKIENNPASLWVPRDLPIWGNYVHMQENYGGESRQATFIVERRDGEDVVEWESMREILRFHDWVTQGITTDYGGSTSKEYGFQDFCFHSFTDPVTLQTSSCSAANFLAVWDYNASNIPLDSREIIGDLNSLNRKFPITTSLGGVTYAPDGKTVIAAKSVRLAYSYRAGRGEFVEEVFYEQMYEWEGSLLAATTAHADSSTLPASYCMDCYNRTHLKVSRLLRRSVDDEATRLILQDAPLFVMAIVAIVLWLSLTFGTMNRVESRFLVSWVVLLEMVCCLTFAFGVLGYFCEFGDRPYVISSLNAMIPFVLAGVSVDDMIVIEDFFNKCEGKPGRVRETMKAAGIAISTTSVTTIVAFFAGSYTSMPGVMSFCLCAYLAFAWDFVLNVTFFPALIVIDQRRIDAKRHAVVPCVVCHDFERKHKVLLVHELEEEEGGVVWTREFKFVNGATATLTGVHEIVSAQFGHVSSLRDVTTEAREFLKSALVPGELVLEEEVLKRKGAGVVGSNKLVLRWRGRGREEEESRGSLRNSEIPPPPAINPSLLSVSGSSRSSDRSIRSMKSMRVRQSLTAPRRRSSAAYSHKDFMELKAAKIKAHDEEHEEHVVEAFVNNRFAPLLTNEVVQSVVLVASILLAVLMAYLSSYNPRGLELKNIVPDDSYIADFLVSSSEYYPEANNLVAIVIRDTDYSDRDDVDTLEDYIRYLEKLPEASTRVGSLQGTWYQHYSLYLFMQGKDVYDDFYEHLWTFLNEDETGKQFQKDVVCEEDGANKCGVVLSARLVMWYNTPNFTLDQYAFAERVNQKIREVMNSKCFVFNEDWLFAYTDGQMYSLIIENLSLTIYLVFVVMFIFTDNISCIFITLMVFLIDCDMLGIMYVCGINVSSISFVCLLMGIGLSVDYCVHIGHAFTHSYGKTPNDRLVEAIKMMGTSVLKGGFTTFLGTVVLGFASSDAFRSFFKMLFFTVLFGVLHGLVALPVFLATAYNIAGRKAHLEKKVDPLGSDKARQGMAGIKEEEEEGKDGEREGSEGSVPPPPPLGRPDGSPPKHCMTPDVPRNIVPSVANDLRFFKHEVSFRGMGENPMKGGKAGGKGESGGGGGEMSAGEIAMMERLKHGGGIGKGGIRGGGKRHTVAHHPVREGAEKEVSMDISKRLEDIKKKRESVRQAKANPLV